MITTTVPDTYRPDWDLSTIPDGPLYSEVGRRRVAKRKVLRGGPAPTCLCGQCAKCRARAYQRRWRKAQKQQQDGAD